MTDIAKCENEQCINSLDCYRFTAEANAYRQTYLMNMKGTYEKEDCRFYIPNGGQQNDENNG